MNLFRTIEFQLALIYFIPGIVWVLFSDSMLFGLHSLDSLDLYKEASFVVAVAVIIYFMVKLSRKRLLRSKVEIEAREQFLSSLVNSQSNYLVRIYDDYTYRFANRAYRESFNLPGEETDMHNFLENIHDDDKDRFIETLQECRLKKDSVIAVELKHPCNHELSYSYWEFRFIKNTDKGEVKFQGVGYDITARKLQQEKLEQQNEQFKKIAFISSHTVRRPLANIMGLTEILDSENLNNPLNTEIIDQLKVSAKELDEVIFDIAAQTAAN
jgi:PAS domain-containing protein